MRKINIAIFISLILLLTTQTAIATWDNRCSTTPTCDFSDGCYELTIDKEYLTGFTCDPEKNVLDVKLRINYDNGIATLVGWNDLGSDPAIAIDTASSKVFVHSYYDWCDKTCKTRISFKLVFDADGKEYTKWVGVTVDPTGSRILPDIFSMHNSLSATITKVPCEQEEIPEFPTIALPVVAILGLAFFFQRNKD